MTRLISFASILPIAVLVGCTGDMTGNDDSTISCYENSSGIICFGGDDEGDGTEQPPDGGDAVCQDTGCVTHCETTDYGERCVTECEGGLRCVEECANAEGGGEPVCEQACKCPEGEGEGDYCAEHPDDPECFCKANPDHPECQEGGGETEWCATHPDDPECFCKNNPDHPECQTGGGETDYCATHPDDPECFCKANPDHPECQTGGGETDYCATHPDDPECFCTNNPEHPECQI